MQNVFQFSGLFGEYAKYIKFLNFFLDIYSAYKYNKLCQLKRGVAQFG